MHARAGLKGGDSAAWAAGWRAGALGGSSAACLRGGDRAVATVHTAAAAVALPGLAVVATAAFAGVGREAAAVCAAQALLLTRASHHDIRGARLVPAAARVHHAVLPLIRHGECLQ